MQKIVLLCVGSVKTSWIKEGIAEYASRMRSEISLETVEVPASKHADAAKQMEEECDRLLTALDKRDGDAWVLDEHGTVMSSSDFATHMETARDGGRTVIFLLGGAHGLTAALRARAVRRFSLSPMTFPHELCRLIFMEQLYRVTQILRGTGYHH